MEKQFTLKQAAELLNIPLTLLRVRISQGYVIAKKYEGSNRLYVSEKEINRVMENMK